jgi:hypothetical protein
VSTQQPWRESAHTQIWDVTERARQFGTQHPQDDASLAVWFVHAPWMHPFWCWHYVSVIHLRDLPGQSKPAVRTVPGATHELIVLSVDPDTPPDLKTADLGRVKYLTPPDVVQQFIAANDAEALRRIEEGLGLTVDGQLTLDSDGRMAWRHLLLGCSA